MKLIYLAISYILITLVTADTRKSNSTEKKHSNAQVPYKTACGPISCYAAVKYLGGDIPLEEIISSCKWQEGKMTSLGSMQNALNKLSSVRCQAVRMTPSQLSDYLNSGQYAAILPIRKHTDSIDHSVCAFGSNESGILYIDYPELIVNVPIRNLTEVWDGEVLLISESWIHWAQRNWLLLCIPVMTIVYLVFYFFSPRRNSHA